MVKLIKITPHIVWIDHHISAINKYKEADEMISINIDGIRLDGISGCMLTYLWFNVDNRKFSFEDNRDMIESLIRSNIMPDWVKYINDWDLWKFEYGDETKYFHYGLELCINDLNNSDNIFIDLYDDIFGWENDVYSIDDIINKGKSVYKYLTKSNQNLCIYNGFESKLVVEDKEYSVYALNSANVSSDTFISMNDYEYDFFVGFHQKGNNTFQYSLRKSTNSNVDLSKIAEWFGGGGHKSASGFILDYNLFDCKHRWKESE